MIYDDILLTMIFTESIHDNNGGFEVQIPQYFDTESENFFPQPEDSTLPTSITEKQAHEMREN